MERKPMQARLTLRSRAAWDRTLTREGVTITALLEALGMEMAEAKWNPAGPGHQASSSAGPGTSQPLGPDWEHRQPVTGVRNLPGR